MRIGSQTPKGFRSFIGALDNEEVARVAYCYQLGSTFAHYSLLEDTIIQAMAMCDRVSVKTKLGSDAEYWNKFLAKQDLLRSSTLGTLISILAKHGISNADLDYLRWLKNKRDFFVHRFFREWLWPGEMPLEHFESHIRALRYLEIIYQRGTDRVWGIFERAELYCLHRFEGGALAFNPGLFAEPPLTPS